MISLKHKACALSVTLAVGTTLALVPGIMALGSTPTVADASTSEDIACTVASSDDNAIADECVTADSGNAKVVKKEHAKPSKSNASDDNDHTSNIHDDEYYEMLGYGTDWVYDDDDDWYDDWYDEEFNCDEDIIIVGECDDEVFVIDDEDRLCGCDDCYPIPPLDDADDEADADAADPDVNEIAEVEGDEADAAVGLQG